MNYTWQILLDKNNIVFVGVGLNEKSACHGEIIDINGWRVGLVGQSYNIPWYSAKDSSLGIAIYDLEKLKQSIADLKINQAFYIAIFHGGVEYTRHPNQE